MLILQTLADSKCFQKVSLGFKSKNRSRYKCSELKSNQSQCELMIFMTALHRLVYIVLPTVQIDFNNYICLHHID